MWFDYFVDLATNPLKISVAAAGWSTSVAVLLWARRTANPNRKLRLLGLHLALVFFPLVFAALTWECGMFMAECLPMLSIPLLPLAFGLLFTAGYMALPRAYRWVHRHHCVDDPGLARFVQENAVRLNIRTPNLYYLDTARPTAHTFTGSHPSVFVSVGLLELLDRKEIEAVLLHELSHIRNHSSLRAFVARLLPWTAPALAFGDETDPEEERADRVAGEMQGTVRYIESAKSKVRRALLEFDSDGR